MPLPEAPKEDTGAKLLSLVSGLIGSLVALGFGITFGVLELRGDTNFWILVLIAMVFALGCFGLYCTMVETREWLIGGGPARPATSRMSPGEQKPKPLSEACLVAAAKDGLGASIAWYQYFDNDRRLLAVIAVPAGLLGMLMTATYFGSGSAGLGSGAGVFTAAMAASYICLRNAAPRFPHRVGQCSPTASSSWTPMAQPTAWSAGRTSRNCAAWAFHPEMTRWAPHTNWYCTSAEARRCNSRPSMWPAWQTCVDKSTPLSPMPTRTASVYPGSGTPSSAPRV
jgi:hypothetical protein